MTTLIVPPLDADPWPTLGPGVCDFIEANVPHGPGDIRGQPAQIDPETRGLIYRAYEVFPRGHPQAGRRRFKNVGWSLRKGTAKTEKAAWLAAVELHPDGPVRCDGWRRIGRTRQYEPVGAPVRDPYIPMVAYTEEQTEDLAYYALYVMLSEGPLADDFDIGLERIMRIAGDGKAVPLASAPDSRDGARTSFQHFDETHRFTLPRLREAHQTMMANIPKRKLADAWGLETTTAPAPGENSVAEATMDYARLLAEGRAKNPRMFFFHRQAADDHDLTTEEGARAAVLEASGPAAAWSDIESIIALWADPRTDRSYWERVWTNRLVQALAQAFDAEKWAELADTDLHVADQEKIVLGFSGSVTCAALIGTSLTSAHQFSIGDVSIWDPPVPMPETFEVDDELVDAAVAFAFDRYDVWRIYANPTAWGHLIDKWAGRYGKERVIEWQLKARPAPVGRAMREFDSAVRAGDLSHDGNSALARHVAAARRKVYAQVDENDEQLWTIDKERPDSPAFIDAARAAVLSWEARGDAVKAGVLTEAEPWFAFGE